MIEQRTYRGQGRYRIRRRRPLDIKLVDVGVWQVREGEKVIVIRREDFVRMTGLEPEVAAVAGWTCRWQPGGLE